MCVSGSDLNVDSNMVRRGTTPTLVGIVKEIYMNILTGVTGY